MCCFSGPVQKVCDTNIYARFIGNRQQLVYSMKYSSDEPVAMILPIPVESVDDIENAVEFIDMSNYPDFFEYLEQGFPKPVFRSMGFDDDMIGCSEVNALEVHNVGSFEASFVPTIRDFSRLDERFRIPKAVADYMPYANFGFVVFQLKAGDLKVHPMAFSFPSRLDDLFFPTIHVHDGEMHPHEEFDHALYCQTINDLSSEGWRSSKKARTFMKTESENLINLDLPCYQMELRGVHTNQDIYV